ncbi:MAG: hypothetical protein M1828_006418 [Chrysothrix sp. TS-e1954]|nr:MAG: hypothetical protein M1828_006418 [Chrysothrix sp. TS-e1954]
MAARAKHSRNVDDTIVVAFNAFSQFLTASHLTRDMRKLLGQVQKQSKPDTTPRPQANEQSDEADEKVASPEDIEPWTMSHSYFALAGGFVYDLGSENSPFKRHWSLWSKKKDVERFVLTPRALLWLFQTEPDLIPRGVSTEWIQDKSKSDYFVKTLVVVQAMWFCIQCIVRVAQGLSISLLELNTAGHALCALIINGLWWKKPQDVSVPLVLSGSHLDELVSVLFLSSSTTTGKFRIWGWPWPGRTAHYSFCVICRKADANQISFGAMESLHRAHELGGPQHPGKRLLLYGDSIGKYSFQDVLGTFPTSCANDQPPPFLDCTPADCQLMEKASKAVDWYALSDNHKPSQNLICADHSLKFVMVRTHNVLRRHTSDMDWTNFLAFALAAIPYGSLHCLAWNAPFPNRATQYLWRISSVAIVSTGPAILLLVAVQLAEIKWGLVEKMSEKRHRWPQWLQNVAIGVVDTPFVLFMMAAVWLYVVARAFVVVESVINLAHLPDSAFQQPNFSRYTPHIT